MANLQAAGAFGGQETQVWRMCPSGVSEIRYSVGSGGMSPAVRAIQTTTRIQDLGSRRGAIRGPASMRAEFERRLQGMRKQHRGPATERTMLGWEDVIRWQLWHETLSHERRHQGKILPSSTEMYWTQYHAREVFLRERPRDEWKTELGRLVQEEMRLDASYRALRWFAAQLWPSTADGSPTEGVGYGGVGLLHQKMYGDPDFGSDEEWRLENILDFRDEVLDLPEEACDLEELEFLVEQEWELEIAYKRLFDGDQQPGMAPVAWDCPGETADSHEDAEQMGPGVPLRFPVLTAMEEAAMIQRALRVLECRNAPEVPQAERQDNSIKVSEGEVETGAGRLVNGDQQQVESIASGAPAEALATGQSATSLSPASEKELDPESLRDDFREPFPQQQISPTGVEEAILPPQQLDITPMFIPPAEALTAGQSAAGLCPPSELDPGSPRDDLSELFPQHLDTTPVFIPPAEALATGQSAAGLCPPSELDPGSPRDDLSELVAQHLDTTPVYIPPAEALAAWQSVTGPDPALSRFLEGLGDSPCQKSPQKLVTEPGGEKILPPLQLLNSTIVYVPLAEALATGQSDVGLCPASEKETESPGDSPCKIPPQRLLATPGEKQEPFPPQLHSTASLCSLQAEALASGQRIIQLPSISATQPRITGVRTAVPTLQRLFLFTGDRMCDFAPQPQRRTFPFPGCLGWKFATNAGPDQFGVRNLVSLFLKGEKCDRTHCHCVLWKGLRAGLLPTDYGPEETGDSGRSWH